MRCCRTCGHSKPASEYYVKNKKNGLLMIDCKVCICAQRKQYLIDHPERKSYNKPEIRERRKKKWRDNYWADPHKFRALALAAFYKRHDAALTLQRQRYHENPEAAVAKSLKWNNENPDKVQAWKDANPDKMKEYGKRYRDKNPEAATISASARRARMRCAKVERIKPGIDKRLMKLQGGKCIYCPADLNVVTRHRDHIISLSRGGHHAELNLQLLCKPCNLRKHAKHPLDFAAEMGIVKHATLVAI
jgi:5-methylcytosine-specific restriction endonuclease McrA